MYLTHEEYTELGFNLVSVTEFKRYERESRQLIRYQTTNKSDKAILGDSQEDIKYLMCFLIDLAFEQSQALNDLQQGMKISRQGVASESVTDHSVSFKQQSENSITELEDSYSNRVAELIRKHLIWTGLLYRGL